MLPLLAALPTIFGAVQQVSSLFDKGKDVVEQVTGKPSVASTPDELQTEIQQLPQNKQNQWAEIMSKEVDKYVAQNERLATDIGLIDSNLTSKVSTDAADEAIIMRMTTRPWAVRWMVRYVLLPFILAIIDIIQNLIVTWLPFIKIKPYNTFEHFFGVMLVPADADANALETFMKFFSESGGPTTFAGQLYIESLPWVVSVILTYMTLREVGKWNPHSGSSEQEAKVTAKKPAPISIVSKGLSESMDLVSRIRKHFRK